MLAVCDVPPRRAMYLMGHTDPTLTLAVYQQVLDMGKDARRDPRADTGLDARRGSGDLPDGEARAADVYKKA